MQITLPLDEMTYEEKWAVIEAIYADLAGRGQLMPAGADGWQAEELNRRQAAVASGEATFRDWEEAKRDLFNRLS